MTTKSATNDLKQSRTLGWLTLLAVVAIVWLSAPFAIGIIFGALLAFALEPLYLAWVKRARRPLLASLTLVIGSGVVIIAAAIGFTTLFVNRAIQFANAARVALREGGSLHSWVGKVDGWLGHVGLSADELTSKLEDSGGEVASRAAGIAGSFTSVTLHALLSLFFALLTAYFVLRYWSRIVDEVVAISPLNPDHMRHLLDEFKRVGRLTLSGTFVTALVQGALATVGFWISGVPQPIFFGVTTALTSLIPAVGTVLVWLPAGIYLIASDHIAKGIVELCWGALVVVGVSDYVIRPRLVKDQAMPILLIYIALFGGIELLGVSGIVLGPVIMALAIAVLHLYSDESAE